MIGDKVLLTECYGPGAAFIDLKGGKPKEVWTDAEKDRFDRSLACHWSTPIHVNGFVYGSSGRESGEAETRCVELATGDVKWAKRKTLRSTFLLVDEHLIAMGESGTLSLIKVNPAKYDEVSKYDVPELAYPCWAPPVLSNGTVRPRTRLPLP